MVRKKKRPRKLIIGDNYILDLSEDMNNIIDPRVGVAAALVLDSAWVK